MNKKLFHTLEQVFHLFIQNEVTLKNIRQLINEFLST